MKKSLVYLFILSVVAIISLATTYYFLAKKEHQGGHYLILSSGNEGTPYFDNAKYIEGLLNRTLREHQVINMSSEGSYENFERLQNKTADLIIAQRDVIIDKYYSKDDPFKSFEILLPLFPEALQILVNDSAQRIIPYREFASRVQTGRIKTIGVGPEGSTTNKTFEGIRSILGLDIPMDVQLIHKSLPESLTDFEQGAIDAIVYFSAVPIKKFDPVRIHFAIVTFDEKDRAPLLTYFKDLESTYFSSKLYFENKPICDINTLGTWAFLICSTEFENSSEEEVVDSIPKIIANDLMVNKPDNQIQHSYSSKVISLKKDGLSTSSFIDSSLNTTRFFMNIPLTKGASELFNVFTFSNQRILLTLSVSLFILAIVAVIVFRVNKNIELIKWREKYGHNLYVVMTTLTILVCLCYIIRGSELLSFYKYGVKSPILNLRLIDTFEWLTIFVFTHHDSHIFPITTAGAIAASSAFILGSGAVLSSIFIQILQNDKIKNRAMGKLQIKDVDHLVICGWNNKTAELAINLLDAATKHANRPNDKIILLNTVIQDFESNVKNDKLHILYHRPLIEYCNGEATDINTFRQVNLQFARTVIIVSEGKDKTDDEKVLLTVYAIRTYCKEVREEGRDSIYIVAEITDPEFIPRLEKAGANVIISTGELVNNLIVQDSICRGIYNPIRSLISYSDTDNDFYSVQVRKDSKLIGKNFNELSVVLRAHCLQLIGFKKVFTSKDGTIISDKIIIKHHLDKKHLKSEYIINPNEKKENNEKTEENDEIILLALSREQMEKDLLHLENDKSTHHSK
jgi:TRAP-type uncharacterized transport system substrate-binding protein/Trk K+ transport system NAD-binding subunit